MSLTLESLAQQLAAMQQRQQQAEAEVMRLRDENARLSQSANEGIPRLLGALERQLARGQE